MVNGVAKNFDFRCRLSRVNYVESGELCDISCDRKLIDCKFWVKNIYELFWSHYHDYDPQDERKMRPVDIEADVKEMERRKRVEAIMNSQVSTLTTMMKSGKGKSF